MYKLLKIMDFVNRHTQRVNRAFPVNDVHLNRLPKKEVSELEKLNNQMIESIRTRMQNLPEEDNNYQSFKKMVDHTRGHDTSYLTGLTKEFLESKRKNFSQ